MLRLVIALIVIFPTARCLPSLLSCVIVLAINTFPNILLHTLILLAQGNTQFQTVLFHEAGVIQLRNSNQVFLNCNCFCNLENQNKNKILFLQDITIWFKYTVNTTCVVHRCTMYNKYYKK